MSLRLVEPDKKYLPSIYEAIEEYKADCSKFDLSTVKAMIAAADGGFAEYFDVIKKTLEA